MNSNLPMKKEGKKKKRKNNGLPEEVISGHPSLTTFYSPFCLLCGLKTSPNGSLFSY